MEHDSRQKSSDVGNFDFENSNGRTLVLHCDKATDHLDIMAPVDSTIAKRPSTDLDTVQIDPAQTLRAATALLRKIQSDQATRAATNNATAKANLLTDGESDTTEDDTPIWLVLSTKKHIVDKKRLKPGKILLPHPYLNESEANLRICLITADPQRQYKDLIAHPSFPIDLAGKIGRVIGLTKLKSKYKSYESLRQLYGEYDIFLADDRVITYLPQILGKVFYKSGAKRPIPVTLEGKRQTISADGTKRATLKAGGGKVSKSPPQPLGIAREIQRSISSALVHLAPSTTTAVKVGHSSMLPEELQQNIETVTTALVDKFVPQRWRNVRSVHIKGPETAALPIWMTEELWVDEKDVLEEAPEPKAGKKRKTSGLVEDVIEVPGPDGKMRRLERTKDRSKDDRIENGKKRMSAAMDGEAGSRIAERAEKAARKERLSQQKQALKENGTDLKDVAIGDAPPTATAKSARKPRMRAADLL